VSGNCQQTTRKVDLGVIEVVLHARNKIHQTAIDRMLVFRQDHDISVSDLFLRSSAHPHFFLFVFCFLLLTSTGAICCRDSPYISWGIESLTKS
jgi:hypothetical protein